MKIIRLEDLGIVFDPNMGCNACDYDTCVNNAVCLKTGKDVHLLMKKYQNESFFVSSTFLSDDCNHLGETLEFNDESLLTSYLTSNFTSISSCF